MPAPATTDEFLDLVQKSGVADWPRLTGYVDKLRAAGGLPDQPTKLGTLLVRDALLTFFQAEQILQGKWKRFSIGKYKVLERLGSGGMGQVFLCEHKLMRRRVAVKVLPTAKAADQASLDRFYREARAVAALDHPNLVRAYDIDHDEGLHFLVMEFVDGVNLQDLVKAVGPLPIDRACHYIYGSAVGLQYADSMGIVHRDIKPANILVDRSGVVKILDMGLARFFHDEDDQLTRQYDETVLGTADYLSPEQAVDSHTVDQRADLYSLGGTFYYLLTGLPPFPEGTVAQKLLWHQTREPKPVTDIRPDVPVEVAEVVETLMKKEPAGRYQTPAELMAALQPFVQTPIPPPADRELPKLSPAAGGGTAGRQVSGVLLAGGSPMTSSSGGMPVLNIPAAGGSSKKTTPAAAPVPPPPAAVDDSAKTMQTRTPTPAPMPAAVAVTPDPVPAADGGVWEALGGETASGTTAPTVRRTEPAPSRRKAPAAKPKPVAPADPAAARKRKRLMLIGAGAAIGLAALGGLAVLAFSGGSAAKVDPKAGPVEPAGPRKLYVSKSAGPDPGLTFGTIQDAINKAKSGDTIVLLDDRYEQRATFTGTARKDVTLEGGTPGKPPVWAAPPVTRPVQAVLGLSEVVGFTLRNVQFEAGGRAQSGLLLANDCPGLTVEDVTVRGGTEAGVRLLALRGTADKPVRLTRVRVVADGAAGVLAGGDRGRAVAHVKLDRCRIEGPAAAGLQIDGPLDGLEVRHCRVFNVSVGVAVADLQPTDPFKLELVGNTFHTVKEAGLKAGKLPAKADLAVRQNYFAKTGVLAKGAGAGGLKAADNARDAGSKEGNPPLKAAEVKDDKMPPPKPEDDGTFLRYGKDSPLNAVGPAKVSAGVPPGKD